MRRSLRVLASGALAIGAIGGVLLLLVLAVRGRPAPQPARPLAAAPEPTPREAPAMPAAPAPSGEERKPAAQGRALPAPPPEETPLEEILAESGEDPGAVYYASRVREALKEGNPAFARELLRQMKEAHPDSVLVEEAESLFGTKR